METAEILQQLERVPEGSFPHVAIEAAVAQRDEITPALLRILENTIEHAEELADDNHYMAHLYAMFLLGQFRESRAYPLLLRFALLPGDTLESLSGDFMSEDFGRILASVCDGDMPGIQSLIENENAYEWIRVAALTSLVTLVVSGQKSRDEVIAYFASLFRGGLVREWSNAWDGLVNAAADLWPGELLDDIKRAYDDSLIDESYIGWDDVRHSLAQGKEHALAKLGERVHNRLVENTAAEMQWWACFRDQSQNRAKALAQTAVKASSSSPFVSQSVTEVKYSSPKPGRNDPCPCGSGRKYKKCCAAPVA